MNTRCQPGDLAIIAYDVPATGGFRFMEPGEMLVEHPDDWMTPVDPDDLDEGVAEARMKGVPA